jgi:HAD superfamily hydrolase (TIGR01509 family)/HAD superfamily hydrolase (TIGR01549 family)
MNTAPDARLRYDTVVFDVGGTLLGFHDWTPFREFLTAAGLPDSEEDAKRFHRRLIEIIVDERDNAQGLGSHSDELDAWWHNILLRAWAGRTDLAQEMSEWMLAGKFDRLYDDVYPTLNALQALGLDLGILSNFGTHLRTVLDRFDLAPYFDFIIVSAEVGMAKPDPRIFERVVAAAGRPATRILYVGDHMGDDIEGARSGGVPAVLIDRGDHLNGTEAPRIGSLLDLLAYVQPPSQPARAVLFDMDGVVLDSMPDHLITWQEALAPLGIELTAADLYPLEGVPTEKTAERLSAQRTGQAVSPGEAERLAHEKRARFRRRFEPRLVAGMAPLLYDLAGRGYRMGLVTGSARSVVDESLAPTGITALFDSVVAGDEVSQGKPDPESYRTAAQRLGIDPVECLVVENAPLGIQSATAAGMACVALETTLPGAALIAAGATRVFRTADALRNWLISEWQGKET